MTLPISIEIRGTKISWDSITQALEWAESEWRTWRTLARVGATEAHHERYSELWSRIASLSTAINDFRSAEHLAKNNGTPDQVEAAIQPAIAALSHCFSMIPTSQEQGVLFPRLCERAPEEVIKALLTWANVNHAMPTYLWHYTTIFTLCKIIENGVFWASDARFLNDTSEYSYAMRFFRERLFEYKRIPSVWGLKRSPKYDEFEWDSARRVPPGDMMLRLMNKVGELRRGNNTYLASFCETENLLSQWRGYGGTQPIAIGFDAAALRRLANDQGGDLLECLYDEVDQERRIVSAIRPQIAELYELYLGNKTESEERTKRIDTNVSVVASELVKVSPMLKHPDFREEKEWRFVIDLQQADTRIKGDLTPANMTPHFHLKLEDPKTKYLPIRRIVIGPARNQQATFEALRRFLRDKNRTDIAEPELSATPFMPFG
jgi:hypothetical protein